MGKLSGKVALVAGATRGAGRGIARVLGEAGATVYCTGRSTRERPTTTGPFAGRRETIEETAEGVAAAGGVGIPVRVDHSVESDLADLFRRIREEQGRLESYGESPFGPPRTAFCWKLSRA
jgi:NAD(P)-dependent dehydrogenase (short-subunit alcohol dehydrogenase family)